MVPPLLDFMAKSPMVEKYDLSSVRLIFCGAAPLSKISADQLMTKYPNIKVIMIGTFVSFLSVCLSVCLSIGFSS